MQEVSIFARSPSFNCYSSPKISAKISDLRDDDVTADNSTKELKSSENQPQEQQEPEEAIINGTNEDDFEFSLISGDPESSSVAADEIFFNGKIRPTYPVFNRDLIYNDTKPTKRSTIRLSLRKLLIEERDPPSSSSSESDELDGVPAGTYCVWTPKSVKETPERCKKSNSIGSSKRWKILDFLNRSNSDGKETYVFVAPTTTRTKTKKRDEKVEKDDKTEISKERRNFGEPKVSGEVKAKGVFGDRVLNESDRRQSNLPYRQDLVGIFANVNGLSRNLHPF